MLARLAVLAVLVAPTPCAASVLRVSGNHLKVGKKTVRLIGVDRSGTEFACTSPNGDGTLGYGIFQGPVDRASIKGLISWRVNAVALPLNEACWLGGIGKLDDDYSGAAYRSAVKRYVNALNAKGIFAVIRLSGAAPGDRPYGSIPGASFIETPMANKEHSIAFWRSAARTFKANRMVIFHSYDEPNDISWDCLLEGCLVNDRPEGNVRYGEYRSAGQQSLVDAIRSAGARHPIILSGPNFAGDLSEWRAHLPRDPRHALVAGVSTFDYGDYVRSHEGELERVASRHPVVIGGFGDTDCNSDYSEAVMRIADRIDVSYLAWTWNTVQDYGGCHNALLDSGDPPDADRAYRRGLPSGFGRGVREHYREIDALSRYG